MTPSNDQTAFAVSGYLDELMQQAVKLEEQLLYDIVCKHIPAPAHPNDVKRFSIVLRDGFGDRYGVQFDGEDLGMVVRVMGFDNRDFVNGKQKLIVTFYPGRIRF